MTIKILMPALSPTMTEGSIAKWLKNEGDQVLAGDILAEIETDKATMELEASSDGILGKIVAQSGAHKVKVNSIIAFLLEEGEDISSIEISDTKIQESISNSLNSPQPAAMAQAVESNAMANNTSHLNSREPQLKIFASPLAKKIAQINSCDLALIEGTGPHGRVVKADVMSYMQDKSSAMQHANGSHSVSTATLKPHTSMRKIIAQRLTESKSTVPHFYLQIECIIDKLLEIRSEINAALVLQERISVNDFIILAVAKAMIEVPEINSSFEEDGIRYHGAIDISVAVAIDQGLITPIIKNADQKPLVQISKEMKELAQKAKSNSLKPSEFQGGGFTISNLGMYGICNFSAIINPPQSCILAVGSGIKKPVVIDDAVAIRHVMAVTLSCDHRVVDGELGARFLKHFKKFIEHPMLMFVN